MRIPEARIKEAILHLARQAALAYFGEAYSRDTEVMSLAIQAIEKYGRDGAFRFIHPICDLAQSEATVDWVIRELTQGVGGDIYLTNLSRLLEHAAPHLLLPRLGE